MRPRTSDPEHGKYRSISLETTSQRWDLLNCAFGIYRICRPFLKGIHIALDSWRPHRYPEGWKQEPDGLYSDLLEDKLGDEAEEALDQITGTPRKGAAIKKGEPKTVRAVQRWFSDLQVN